MLRYSQTNPKSGLTENILRTITLIGYILSFLPFSSVAVSCICWLMLLCFRLGIVFLINYLFLDITLQRHVFPSFFPSWSRLETHSKPQRRGWDHSGELRGDSFKNGPGQLQHTPACILVQSARLNGQQHSSRYWSREWADYPTSEIKEEWTDYITLGWLPIDRYSE